jgi:hypothetical protein
MIIKGPRGAKLLLQRNGKAKTNPARLVRLYKEENGRVRFISYEEEATIRTIIRERCPTHRRHYPNASDGHPGLVEGGGRQNVIFLRFLVTVNTTRA